MTTTVAQALTDERIMQISSEYGSRIDFARAVIAADRAERDCALKRGSVMCRECDLNTIAAHSNTPNDRHEPRL